METVAWIVLFASGFYLVDRVLLWALAQWLSRKRSVGRTDRKRGPGG
jgi:hypothetical protein